MSARQPARPGEVPDTVPLGELLARAQAHAGALFDHRVGIAPLVDADRAGHAVGQLVHAAALSERVVYGRWVYAVEALDAGAAHGRVAEAMGLDIEELHVGVRGWARGQLRHGLIDNTRHAEVLALLGDPPATDPADHLPAWRQRRLAQLLDALDNPPLSLAERAALVVLAGQDPVTVDHLAAVLRRVRGVR